MAKFALFTLLGVLLGVLAVWWIQPETSGGTTFIVTITVVAVTAIAQIISSFRRPRPPRGGEK